MSQNSTFTNIKSIHIDYTLFMSISLSILSLKLSMTMGTLYLVDGYGVGSGDSETRWDLYWVPNSGGGLIEGGDFIRQLAQHYSKVLLLLAPMH